MILIFTNEITSCQRSLISSSQSSILLVLHYRGWVPLLRQIAQIRLVRQLIAFSPSIEQFYAHFSFSGLVVRLLSSLCAAH